MWQANLIINGTTYTSYQKWNSSSEAEAWAESFHTGYYSVEYVEV